MNDIRQIVRRVALRLGWDRANHIMGRALAVALGVACIGILCDKLLFLGAPVFYAIGGIAAACVVTTIVLAVRGWPSANKAAVAIDDRLRLGERISSALAVADDPSPMSRAVVTDGSAYARSVSVAKTFPLRLHREYWAVFALAFIAIGLLGLMPQYDLLSRKAAAKARAAEREELKKEAARMRAQLATIRKKVERTAPARVNRELDELEKIVGKMELGKVTRAEALAKLSELGESLKKQYEHMEDGELDMRKALQRTSLALSKEFAEALANKDFAKAAEELKTLAQKAASGQLTPEEKETLKNELKALAEALGDAEKLPEALQKVANALNEANPADAQKLLEQALAQAQEGLEQQEAMAQELEALKEFAKVADKAGDELGNRIAITDMAGIYNAGEGEEEEGAGAGGMPPGHAGVMQTAPDTVAFQPNKIKGQMQEGRIVGSYFADGTNLKGEAHVEFSVEAEAAETAAAQALQSEQVPRAYEGYVREYFGEMKNY